MAGRKPNARGKQSGKVKADRQPSAAADHGDPSEKSVEFPIVAIGASAGGLDAFVEMLEALPTDTGMAFVLIQHLSPDHPSSLAAILARATPMPVTEVKDQSQALPNHIYVIPPGQDMIISSGRLKLSPREVRGQHRPIDLFFRSLAESCKHLAIAGVFSGTGNDGTLGAQAIKAEGGITFAQDASAQHDSMPRSAIASGAVDFVLSPVEVAHELSRIARSNLVTASPVPGDPRPNPGLIDVVQILHQATGVDFTNYKVTTLQRRIARRMLLRKIETFSDYATYLQQNPRETEALYQDVLIHVTKFFRDPESYEALKEHVFPELVKDKPRYNAVRIWSLGCSTGEEVYSLVIAFAEFVESSGIQTPIQIFATDLNEISIQKARTGIYPKYIAQDVSPERLTRFFSEVDGSYRIHKSIRELCVFAKHNVLVDPPFARIDLVSCRNLMIYLQPALQRNLMPILHYALHPAGFLWVGASETIGSYRDLFEIKDSKHKIYRKRFTSNPAEVRFGLQRLSVAQPDFVATTPPAREVERTQLYREGDRLLLARYSPPSVLVSSDLEVLQFRGDTSPYLASPPGKATFNLLRMAREGVLPRLRTALTRARTEGVPVREENLQVRTNGGFRAVSVEVIPVNQLGSKEDGFLVLFLEPTTSLSPTLHGQETSSEMVVEPRIGEEKLAGSLKAEQQIERLNAELATVRDYLQSVVEQQEAANEELQSANEEALSANEELQSVNEELETSKEEIESSNEELATVNDELNDRNLELSRLNNDLNNIFDNVEMPVLLIDRDMRIRRFTKDAQRVLNFDAGDVGRPISHLQVSFNLPDIESLVTEAIDSLAVQEREIQDPLGRWFSLRVRPYKTLENNVDGAILTLVDIDTIKRARTLAQDIVDTLREPLLVLDAELRVQAATRSFYQIFQVSPEVTENRFFSELGNGQWNNPQLRSRLEQVLEKDEGFSDYAITYYFEDIGSRMLRLNARRLLQDSERKPLILLAIEDVTTREELQQTLVNRAEQVGREEELARANRNKDQFLAMLAHELRNPLAPLANAVEILATRETDAADIEVARKVVQRQLQHVTRMIDDLLDVSRIDQGKIELRKRQTDLVSILKGAIELSRKYLQDRRQTLDFPVPDETIYLEADEIRLEQVFGNLLNNASKFSDPGAVISMRTEVVATPDGARNVIVRVRDTGVGIDSEVLPHIFELFFQGNRSLDRSHGGLGIGLTLAQRLVGLHGGSVEARSEGPKRGSEFIVQLPVLVNPDPDTDGLVQSAGRKLDHGPRRRILVVDDHEDSVTIMAALLRTKGYDVATARHGVAAIEIASAFCPDLVILDIGLPGIDGFEVARQLREIPAMAAALIVGLSGYGADSDRTRAREAGFNHHLTKPVEPQALLEFLSQTLAPEN
jgi:two-component system, chemotaxis family, CheB/CheR fusion protein